MNARSCPAVPIRRKAGTPSGHANDVVEINDFRPSEGVEIPFPVSRNKFLITRKRDYKAKLHADETN